MRRRDFIIGVLAANAAPLRAHAQGATERPARIGVISPAALPPAYVESFRAGLRRLGHVEGRTLVIEFRDAEQQPARLAALAEELAGAGADIIVSIGPALRPASGAASTVPIVFMFSGDALNAGLVESLSRPGGNRTGISYMVLDLAGKRIEQLREIVPRLSRLGVISNPAHAGEQNELQATVESARSVGVEIDYHQVRAADDMTAAFAAMKRNGCNGFTAFSDALTVNARRTIAALAADHRLPGVYGLRLFAEAGGLMSYGPVFAAIFGKLAVYVDKLLRGARPSELPVAQPDTFELVINLSAARQLGLELPSTVLARADEVIE